MKYIFILSLFAFTSFKTPANTSTEVIDQISNSFKHGNSDLLVSMLAPQIELTIESEKIAHPKVSNERAGLILSSFFRTNPPLSFKYLYQGNTSGNLKYCVANYHSNQKDFLIYMLISKNANKQYLVKSLQVKES